MEYIHMYTIYSDVGLFICNKTLTEDNEEIIKKHKEITAQRDKILLKKFEDMNIGVFPMTFYKFQKIKENFLKLSLNNALLHLMFVTQVGHNETRTILINMGQEKTFESKKKAYDSIYNLEENSYKTYVQHRVPVYN